MNVPSVLALLTMFVALPLNVYVTARLWRLSNARPQLRVLRERAIAATALTVIVVVFGIIFLNNDLPVPYLDLGLTKLITRLAVVVMSVAPTLYWLRLYRDQDDRP